MDLLQNELLNSFLQINKALYALVKEDADRAGLTVVQLKTLYKINQVPAIGLRELAESQKLTNSTMSGVVDRLVAGGLLLRHTSSADRRAITLKLTDEGTAKLAEASGDHSSFKKKFKELDTMSEEAKRALLHMHSYILSVLTDKEENAQ
ncbi:transcriptional regulator, TrmB [Fictibacillus macauensis ZFHKF-1]|uniref:Transcriptional regulator, TrmB n=1 Tax=Fictibacillus macauensis ZFHKF-1 TaxID=1196324 RepID=I8IVZ7_9BACL|nr:MarR family transcriptional regulator [Fictibacillus macauensis]EIT83651.1 transcriptional regulator, TrmB [Fictibacillus macauensis ZFHKF-1]